MKKLHYRVTLTFAKNKDFVNTQEILRGAIESAIKSTVLASLRVDLPAVRVEILPDKE